MSLSRYMPCTDCGASVDRYAPRAHQCDPQQKQHHQLHHQPARLHQEVTGLEDDFARFLATPEGEFEAFLARRRVRGDA